MTAETGTRSRGDGAAPVDPSEDPLVVVVPAEAVGARLDRFLATALSGMPARLPGGASPSRGELQRWIERGNVTVDGVVRKAADKLRAGSRIEIVPVAPAPTTALPEDGIDFRVVHLDDAIVVVEKPAGLVVHPARGHRSGTLVNGLLALGLFDFDDEEQPSEQQARPGVVHRLDKGTSGVMVVARTPAARESLKEQFAAHTIEREYVAIVACDVPDAVHIDTLHGRHPRDRLKFSSRVKVGKRAVTDVRPLERLGGGLATLASFRLNTGRTHQIRVHAAEVLGAQILGDPLYGKLPTHPVLRAEAEALGHPALHARVLGFVHPSTGERVRYETDPPADFEVALTALRAIPSQLPPRPRRSRAGRGSGA
ncbi:MAG: RluA family pseudouridine synthase [Myxococcales bacterium]|nr:RluA family pseudouridine synthase [Myxococcales bacterium]